MEYIKNSILNFFEYMGVNNYDNITDNLLLGNYKSTTKNYIYNSNIDVVVNCTPYLPFHNKLIHNYRISVYDDLTNKANLDLLESIINILPIIHNHVLKKHKILIHCKAGMQRSAAVTAAYLMKYHNLSIEEAKSFIKSRRSVAFFMGSNFNLCLLLFQKHLNTLH